MITGFYTYSPEYIVTHMNEFLVTKDNKAYPIKKEEIYKSIAYDEYDNYDTIKIWCEEFDIPFVEEKWKEVISLLYCDNAFETYLELMKLPGYKYFTYKDSDRLNEESIYGYTD